MYQKILVATDGSKLSRMAVEAASKLAVQLGCILTIVHVVPKYPQTYFDGSSVLSIREMDDYEKELTEKAQQSLDQLRKTIVDKHISVNTLVTRGSSISDTLIKVAHKTKSDLIVMASHGRGGIKRVLIGSETLQVLTHSEIPVLVIR